MSVSSALARAFSRVASRRPRLSLPSPTRSFSGGYAPPPPPPRPAPLPPWAALLGAAAGLSGGVMLQAMFEARADARDVLALPLREGCAVVFLELADGDEGGAPLGRLTVQLRSDAAPRAATNFLRLCTHAAGYGYRRSPVLGIERGRRLLAGDFFGSGAGSHSSFAEGAAFADEAGGLALRHIGPGIVAMRNSGPNSNGSQFYVSLRRLPDLDGRSVVVGHVVDEDSLRLLEFVERHFATGGDGRLRKGHDLRIANCGVLDESAVAQLRARRAAAHRS